MTPSPRPSPVGGGKRRCASLPLPGEVVYKDTEGVLCRRMNWHEADRTKLRPETKNAVLVIESLDPSDPMPEILSELQALAGKFCGGTAVIHLLDRGQPTVELS